MPRTVLRNGDVVTPDGIVRADVVVDGGRIADLADPGTATSAGDELIDATGRTILPGFIRSPGS